MGQTPPSLVSPLGLQGSWPNTLKSESVGQPCLMQTSQGCCELQPQTPAPPSALPRPSPLSIPPYPATPVCPWGRTRPLLWGVWVSHAFALHLLQFRGVPFPSDQDLGIVATLSHFQPPPFPTVLSPHCLRMSCLCFPGPGPLQRSGVGLLCTLDHLSKIQDDHAQPTLGTSRGTLFLVSLVARSWPISLSVCG